MTFVPATLLSDPDRTHDSMLRLPVPTANGYHAPVTAPLVSPALMALMSARIDAHLRGFLTLRRADYLRQPVFAALYDDLTEFTCRQGKRLRPLLFLLAHQIFQRGDQPESLQPATHDGLLAVGVSLELLHAFILVHDDIIDRAETRRGLPTLHRLLESRLSTFSDRGRAGRNLALVLGDILFALSQKCLLEASLPAGANARLGALLLGCMAETGFGEVADIIHGTRDVAKISPAEIELMYHLKTTRYTVECPLAMAAILNGIDAAGVDTLGHVARPAGLAFQIQNDLQEFARFEVSDAEVPADILEGKKTLLMRAAFDLLNETDQGLLQLCFSTGAPTEGTVSKARELITKSGAVTVLTERMHGLFRESDQAIVESGFSLPVQEGLTGLIHLVRGVAAGC